MSINEATLQGNVAVVTGASKGIGAEIAKQLAAAGAAVVVNYCNSKDRADRVVEDICSKGGKAIAIQANITKMPDIVRLFAQTVKAFNRVDILVNNAGMYQFAPLEDITQAHFRDQFELNVFGLVLATQEAVKHFPPAGGSIINVSSVLSTCCPAHAAVYSATKAGVDAVTRSLAKELAARKIRVNSINPGLTETEGIHAIGFAQGEVRERTQASTPLGRIGQPSDIAPFAVFLASPSSGWMTGESVFLTGGFR